MKGHGLFQDLDWEMVIKKQYRPPFVPCLVDETDVQHFDEQFTSRSPRESIDTPPNDKNDNSNVSTKPKPVMDYSDLFENFDYVSEEFINDVATISNQDADKQCQDISKKVNGPKYNTNDIDTDPVDDSDDSYTSPGKKCSKCKLQLDTKDDRSNCNLGDENQTVDELKELRICSHGS